MIDFVFLTFVKFVSLQGIGAPHPSAAVPPPVASHDRGWIGILLGILAVLVLIIIVIVLLFYLRYVASRHTIFSFLCGVTPCHIPFCHALQGYQLIRHTTSTCHAKLCNVMSHYAMPSPVAPLNHVTSCHTISCHVSNPDVIYTV